MFLWVREKERNETAMVLIIGVLTLAACMFEYKLVTKVPILGTMLRKYPLVSLIFSLVLSMILGMFFGAAGVMVFVAGITSTILMQPVYWLMRDGKLDVILAQGRVKRNQLVVAIERNKNNIVSFYRAVKAIITFAVKLVWFPIKYLLKFIEMIGKLCERLSA